MTKYIFLFSLFLGLRWATLSAQLLPLYSQHSEFHGLINPASLNVDFLTNGQNLSIGISSHQWWNIGSATPTTQVLRGEYIDYKNHCLYGSYFIRDRAGITEHIGGYARAAYIQPLGGSVSEGGLVAGLSLGMAQGRLRFRGPARN